MFSLKQEIHDLRQKIDLQSTENDENQNSVRRRFQDTLTELTSQVEALSKAKSRFKLLSSSSNLILFFI
jgi:cell division protein FtsL